MIENRSLCELCALACAGDKAAFDAVFVRLQKYLCSILNRVLRKPWENACHEDLLQEWRMELWKGPTTTVCRAAALGNDGEAFALLGTIIKRKAIDLIRRNRRQTDKERELPAEFLSVAHDQMPTQQIDDAHAKIAWLETHLTSFDWLVIDLRRRNLSYKAIAASEEVLATHPDANEGVVSAVFRRIRRIVEERYEPTI